MRSSKSDSRTTRRPRTQTGSETRTAISLPVTTTTEPGWEGLTESEEEAITIDSLKGGGGSGNGRVSTGTRGEGSLSTLARSTRRVFSSAWGGSGATRRCEEVIYTDPVMEWAFRQRQAPPPSHTGRSSWETTTHGEVIPRELDTATCGRDACARRCMSHRCGRCREAVAQSLT